MSPEQEPSVADVGDRHRRFMALAVLAVGVMYGVQAVEHLVGPVAAERLDVAVMGLAVAIVGLLVPVFVWKARHLPAGEWHLYRGEGGYVAELLSRAHIASWGVTFVFLVALDLILERLPELPAGFFIQVVVAVMSTSFAITFLVLDREPGRSGKSVPDA